MVLLSGHAPRGQAGRGAFQEMDQVGAARPVTKAAWRVEDAARMGEDMTRALAIAAAGRPGPVHLSLPGDLLEAKVADGPAAAPARGAVAGDPPVADATLAQILDLLRRRAGARSSCSAPPWRARPRGRRGGGAHARHGHSRAAGGEPARPQRSVAALGGQRRSPRRTSCCCSASAWTTASASATPASSPRDRRFIQVDWDAAALASDAARGARPSWTIPRAWRSGWPPRPRRASGSTPRWGDEVRAARAARPAGWAALRDATDAAHPPAPRLRGATAAISTAAPSWSPTAASSASGCRPAARRGTRLINGPSGSIGSAIPMALRRQGRASRSRRHRRARRRHLRLPRLRAGHRRAPRPARDRGGGQRRALERRASAPAPALRRRAHGGLRALPTRYDQVATALGAHGEHVEYPADLDAALARAVASGRPACVNVTIDGVPAPTYRKSSGRRPLESASAAGAAPGFRRPQGHACARSVRGWAPVRAERVRCAVFGKWVSEPEGRPRRARRRESDSSEREDARASRAR